MKRIGTYAALICALAIVALPLLRPKQHHDDLLNHAQVLATFNGETVGDKTNLTGGAFSDGYIWLDDHRLLRLIVSPGTDSPGNVFLVNVDTGRSKPFSIPSQVGAGTLVSVSPNAKWLLWNSQSDLSGTPFATTMDGRRKLTWPYPNNCVGSRWMPDGKGWIVVAPSSTGGGSVVIGSVDHVGLREIPLSGLPPNSGVAGFLGGGKILLRNSADAKFSPGYVETRKFYVADLNTPSSGAMPLDVHVPDIADAINACALVSPRGDRILWWFQTGHMSIFSRLATTYLHKAAGSTLGVTVIVTDLHGGHPVDMGTVSEGREWVYSMPKWRPDGRSISFVYGNKLYCKDVR